MIIFQCTKVNKTHFPHHPIHNPSKWDEVVGIFGRVPTELLSGPGGMGGGRSDTCIGYWGI